MNVLVYSIFDSKAKAFLQPFHSPNAAVATRMIMDALDDKTHMFFRHAADYTLFEVATFDDETGIFTPHQSHVNLGVLLTYIPQEA